MSVSDSHWPDGRPRRSRRAPIRDSRLGHLDMRTRAGRRYGAIFRAAVQEFGGADLAAVGEVARLRYLAEETQTKALTGQATVDAAIQASAAAARASHRLASKSKPANPDVLRLFIQEFNELAAAAEEEVAAQ